MAFLKKKILTSSFSKNEVIFGKLKGKREKRSIIKNTCMLYSITENTIGQDNRHNADD